MRAGAPGEKSERRKGVGLGRWGVRRIAPARAAPVRAGGDGRAKPAAGRGVRTSRYVRKRVPLARRGDAFWDAWPGGRQRARGGGEYWGGAGASAGCWGRAGWVGLGECRPGAAGSFEKA